MILFTLLLRLFPREFREAFADDMRRLFVDQRAEARERGLRARAGLWVRTIAGMTSAAWREWRDGRRMLARRLPLVETLVTDLRLTIRMLCARPLFAAIVIAAVQADGTCWCGSSVWQGHTAMRVSVSSWANTAEDVERSLAAIIHVANKVKESQISPL